MTPNNSPCTGKSKRGKTFVFIGAVRDARSAELLAGYASNKKCPEQIEQVAGGPACEWGGAVRSIACWRRSYRRQRTANRESLATLPDALSGDYGITS